jgi:hypothetical protein
MERDPPGAFCYLGSGPTSGRRHGPAPGFGFDCETTSDQIDSAMPWKTHTGRPVWFFAVAARSGGQGIVANSPLTMKKSPCLPVGRAEGFPVQGELCLPAISVAWLIQLVALEISIALPIGGAGFSQKPFIQPLFGRGRERSPDFRLAVFALTGTAAFGATVQSDTRK